MRVDDAPYELAAVLDLDDLQQVLGRDDVAVRRLGGVADWHESRRRPAVRGIGVGDQQATGLVGHPSPAVIDNLLPQPLRQRSVKNRRGAEQGARATSARRLPVALVYQRFSASTDSSSRSRDQTFSDRYFQPPSASRATIVPDSICWAILPATAITPPDETPAKIPSVAVSSRRPSIASAVVTRNFPSSTDGSNTSGTYPSSSERRPCTCSPGIGSAA